MAERPEKLPPIPKKTKCKQSREDLFNMDKNELVDKIIQLEAHNLQLKNIISKNLESSKNDVERNNKKFDFSKCHYRKVLLHIMYFGWDYHGLGAQEDSTQTIEHYLFQALMKSCLIDKRETSQYHRCGRTDKGVSAFGQVISITLRSKLAPEEQNEKISTEMPYCKILNKLFPKDIRAVAWMPLPNDLEFSARFDCKKRQYKYYFPRSSLNIQAMRDACQHLIGSHDFRHLCKMDVGNGVTEFTRKIIQADIRVFDERDCDEPTSMYTLNIEGNAFLWHQIRCIMAVLLLVGEGKESPDIVKELLDIEKNTRKPQYNMALDIPLNLFHCSYELDGQWYYDVDDLKNVINHLQNEWTLYSVKSTMIKDCLKNLIGIYQYVTREKEREDNPDMSESDSITAYTECLLQGVKPRVYKPLLKRNTCSSLEERVEHYMKKRKIPDVEVVEDKQSNNNA